MNTKQVTEQPLGTRVFLIENGNISQFTTIGFHPNHKNYFYLSSSYSVKTTKCLFLSEKQDDLTVWETDYEKAKEIMWSQLVDNMQSANKIYMNNSKSLNLTNESTKP